MQSVLDGKIILKLRFDRGILFRDARNHRGLRAVLEFLAQRRQLRRSADGINLDAPIPQISRVACDVQPLGHPAREVAIAHSLHAAADEVAPGLATILPFLPERSAPRAASVRFYQTQCLSNSNHGEHKCARVKTLRQRCCPRLSCRARPEPPCCCDWRPRAPWNTRRCRLRNPSARKIYCPRACGWRGPRASSRPARPCTPGARGGRCAPPPPSR